ncbi:unnamed protein product [Ceutorhynchus assimilis]|uniref:Uncharacterized protein n=1 Tax=Ceutorhynchus assimilis TaxID=467358 RepID=A0A9N9MWP0_9CUCU|nr:unnamed protein product [Ceutorhynchus assimilis]
MNVTAVQDERGPRKPKLLTAMITERFFSSTNNHTAYETVAHVFLFTIKQVRYNSGFGLLNRQSQNKILGQQWAAVLSFRLAYWTSNMDHVLPYLQTTIKHFQELKLDINEREFFENTILCRKDVLVDDLKESALAEVLQEKAVDGLYAKNLMDKKRFLKILLSISVLYNCSSECLYSHLFKPIIGEVSMESIIATI